MKRISTIPVLDDPASIFVVSLMESKFFPEEENLILEGIYANGLSSKFIGATVPVKVYEDTVAQWIEKKAAQAKEVIKSGTEKAKDKAVQFIAKYGEKFGTYIKMIVDQIRKFLKGAWDYIKTTTTSSLAKDKAVLIEHIKSAKYEGAKIKEEVTNMKDMGAAAMKFLGGGVVKQMEDGMMKAGNDTSESVLLCLSECIHEDKQIISDILSFDPKKMYESDGVSIPGLSKLAHKLAKYPPFSWLHSFEDLVKEKTNNMLTKISYYLKEATGAGGPYEFVIIGTLVGLVAGYGVKTGVHDVVHSAGLTAVGSAIAIIIPGVALLLTIMSWIAKGIWVVGILETTVAAISDNSTEAPAEH